MLYAAPSYFSKRSFPKTDEDLARHDCVLFHPPGMRTDTFGLKPLIPRPRYVATDFCYLRALLLSGAAIGPLPSYVAKPYLDEGRLVRVLPDWIATGSWLFVLYPSSPHVPKKVIAFRDFVIEALGKNET
jgi:DNA-binding transcriptional LysR family regulator